MFRRSSVRSSSRQFVAFCNILLYNRPRNISTEDRTMNWPVLFLLAGIVLIIWSRTGFISHSGPRVFLVSVAKLAASLAGLALTLFGALLIL